VELWTIRTVNPDGHVRGTRQNARGVDLNRNFPRRWRHHGEPGSPYYSGPRPLSEPESRAAARLIRRVEPDVTVWYHQPLELVYESPGADLGLVRRYAEVAGLPSEPPPRLSGTAPRWQNHRDPDSSAFVVELGADRLSPEQVRVHVGAVRAVSRRAAAH
jgi:murein peptide amidase A